MPDPRQGNVFQSKQRRRCGGPVIMYFKSAQTKLFWREMKITLQCMLKFGTLKSLATGAPNENIVQNQLNIALLNVF